MLPLANSRAAPSQRPGGQSEPWKYLYSPFPGRGLYVQKKKRGYRVCSSGYAATAAAAKAARNFEEEEEGLQGVFKRLRRNGHQHEKGLQMAQRGPSLK
jgi:hypothetical protein